MGGELIVKRVLTSALLVTVTRYGRVRKGLTNQELMGQGCADSNRGPMPPEYNRTLVCYQMLTDYQELKHSHQMSF